MNIKIFICYSHDDQQFRKKLEEHLSALSYLGKIIIWQDQEIPLGAFWQEQITSHLNGADIILLLVSSSFLASKYCWNKEVRLALQRHQRGEVKVIPIILRPALWQDTPLGQLQALPTGAKPITQWNDQDAALEDVARGIRAVVDQMGKLEKKLPWSPLTGQSSDQGTSSLTRSTRKFPSRRTVVVASVMMVGIAGTGSVAAWSALVRRESNTSVTPTPSQGKSNTSVTPIPSQGESNTSVTPTPSQGENGSSVTPTPSHPVARPVPVDQLRFVRTLTGHTDTVYSVAISPAGQTLASGSVI